MSEHLSEKNLETYSPFCKHRRRDNKTIPFIASAKTLKAVANKADLFETGLALSPQVSKSNLEQTVQALSSFHTRHTASATLSQVTDWIIGQFQGFGYNSVKLDPFTKNGLSLNNVVCIKPAQDGETETIILCGHFDTIIANFPDNATLRSPGANDNATGVAVILEVARILATVALNRTIQFVCFSGEEKGFWGAEAYSAKIKQANLNLRFLLNLDQIGFPAANGAVVMEHDKNNITADNDQASQLLAETVAQVAQNRLNIPIERAEIERSDYMPFEARGYTVFGLYESGEYQHQHTNRDTIENVDFDYLVNMAKIAVTAMFA